MGNRDVLEKYYIENAESMRGYAWKALGNTADAEDAVQDCFVRLLKIREDILPVSLPALSYKVLINLINDRGRWQRVKREAESYALYHAERCEDMEALISAGDLMRHYEEGISGMPEKYRKIYRLSVEEDKKVGEIAEMLGYEYKATEYCLWKARTTMRRHLRKCLRMAL